MYVMVVVFLCGNAFIPLSILTKCSKPGRLHWDNIKKRCFKETGTSRPISTLAERKGCASIRVSISANGGFPHLKVASTVTNHVHGTLAQFLIDPGDIWIGQKFCNERNRASKRRTGFFAAKKRCVLLVEEDCWEAAAREQGIDAKQWHGMLCILREV